MELLDARHLTECRLAMIVFFVGGEPARIEYSDLRSRKEDWF